MQAFHKSYSQNSMPSSDTLGKSSSCLRLLGVEEASKVKAAEESLREPLKAPQPLLSKALSHNGMLTSASNYCRRLTLSESSEGTAARQTLLTEYFDWKSQRAASKRRF